VAAAAVALAVLAGQLAAPWAYLLCLPAAGAALVVRRKLGVREASLRMLAQIDPLTGVGNARLLRERLAYEVVRHQRHRRRFALFALDLDGFKAVNDRYGHPAGDEVLREVARALVKATRDQDTVVRQGGDEFTVLAPETGWQQADVVAARIEQAVRRAVGGLEGMSASVGYAVFPDEGAEPEALVVRADAAQAEAKRRSRATRRVVRRAA